MVVSKTRQTVAYINVNALKRNIEKIKAHLLPNQQFYAVVKANAYGHGICEIAQIAQEAKVDGFCVALLDEAVALRESGIHLPILVMGVTHANDAAIAAKLNITLSVSDVAFLEAVTHQTFEQPLRVHLAANTGMNRIGFNGLEELVLAKTLAEQTESIQIDGLFTHFATADGENDNFVQKQFERFEQMKSLFINDDLLVHLANSAMTLWRQQFPSDIVRVGIAMYGLNPSDVVLDLPIELEPVLQLETQIVHKHLLRKGESVSYGAKYIAKKDEYVGTLPIGYADGWSRQYAQCGVYINGVKCDVLGVICMDQMMIRIPETVEVGQKVELIGPHQSATDIAIANGTIGYEVLCRLSDRIERQYTME